MAGEGVLGKSLIANVVVGEENRPIRRNNAQKDQRPMSSDRTMIIGGSTKEGSSVSPGLFGSAPGHAPSNRPWELGISNQSAIRIPHSLV